MTGWRQAVFVRQRRIEVIQRALSKVLDEESWSPATPRRLYVGSADASSRGWTMIVPELANFFLDRGGAGAPRLCRLARELRCPAYEIDVRGAVATTLFEVDALGRMRISGPASLLFAGLGGNAELTGLEVSSEVVGFGLLAMPEDLRDRIATLDGTQPMALADYLGAIAGFPAWTRPDVIDSGPQRSKDRNHPTGRVPLAGTRPDVIDSGPQRSKDRNHPTGRAPLATTRPGDDAIAARELVYEPPRIVDRGRSRGPIRWPTREPIHGPTHERTHGRLHGPTHGSASPPASAGLRAQPPETHEAIARTTPQVAPPAHDRRGTRPRSAARPRR